MLFRYHNGPLLAGNFSVNLVWYGKFTPSQRAIVSDFFASIAASSSAPSVTMWWKGTDKYYHLTNTYPSTLSLSLGTQVVDQNCSLGKSLKSEHIVKLASKPPIGNAINVVLTSADVAVEGFCSSRCGTHGSIGGHAKTGARGSPYIWVGNSVAQCPGQCAWPFHQPIYGPQSPPLVAPKNDVGIDGLVINLAGLLAGTVTNPFGNGFYQGPKEAPLEAASACPGIYGKGAYPGYAGELLLDKTTGASYNAHGVSGRKYLLPALYDPSSSTCSVLRSSN